MRTKRVEVRELPFENLAVYQLIEDKTNGIIRDFAEKLGVKPQTIQRLFKKDARNNRYPIVSDDLKIKIAQAFELPEDWVEQTADKLQNEQDENTANAGVPSKSETRPYFLNLVKAGLPNVDVEAYSKPMPLDKHLPNYDLTVSIYGDSMEPTYHSGDVLALLNITKLGFVQWGHAHVICTSQGNLIKRLYPAENGEGFKCVSDNKEKYPPFNVSPDEIYGIYKVVGLIRDEVG